MNIAVTAGGTAEPIDGVRAIVNMATGQLGSLIADSFGKYAEVRSVFYICGRTSVLPQTGKAKITRIGDTDELEASIKDTLIRNKIDVFIHSMAVSDYSVRSVTTLEYIADALEAKPPTSAQDDCDTRKLIKDAVQNATNLKGGDKISSDLEDLVLIMKRTPKVISIIKETSPLTFLVGFKLLNKVSSPTLLDTASHFLLKNGCDLVLANDLAEIHGTNHIGYLIGPEGLIDRYSNKKEIADGIATNVIKRIRENV